MVTSRFESDFQDQPQAVVSQLSSSTRPCLFNLIVISYDLERALYCQELVRIITERFPCRILFVRAEKETGYDVLRQTLSTQYVGADNSTIVCDLLTIEASSKQLERVPYLIIPNIVPDLPVYVVVADDPTQDSSILQQLEQLAARIIFGTPHIDNMSRFAGSIRKLLTCNGKQFVDIHWARSKGWREVLAKVFADPEKLEALQTASNANIVFTAPPGHETNRYEPQVLYTQAWIASQCGWKLEKIEGPRSTPTITYTTKTGTIKVALGVLDSAILDHGALWSLEVTGSSGHHFLISHERTARHVIVHASSAERCEIPYTIFMTNYQR
ncbi:MAG: glucose-6-phosphate dehydrogenase assembly protein OpcA, partial [Candidatus Micrarchaeaceae archaeon]